MSQSALDDTVETPADAEADKTRTPAQGDDQAEGAAEPEGDDEQDTESDGQPEEPEEPELGQPKGRAQQRIQQLVQQKRSVETLLAQKTSQLEEIVALVSRDTDVDPNDPAAAIRSVLREERHRELSREVHALRAARQQAVYQEATVKFGAADPTLAAKIEALPTLSEVTFELMAASDHAAALGKYFVQNPAEAERIAGLPNYRQAYEIARIESKVSAPSQARKVSNAPPPPSAVRTQSARAVQKDPSKMTEAEYAEYFARRQKAKSRK